MVRNIEFKNVKPKFQQQLQNDMKSIKQDPKLLIPADRINNLYRLTTDEYNKLLTENISKSYKRTDKSSLNSINTEAKNIAKDFKLEDRIEQHSQHQSFITLKDHKDNFQNNLKCRLINPAKCQIGIISKHYIEEINKYVRRGINVNQWRNIQEVIPWFKRIKNKEKSSFTKFDIVDFYPSISKELLTNAINFAGKKVNDTIMHSSKSLLFNNHEIWVKKENPNFDVTMGSFDGAEVCELIGLYLLNILKNEFGGKDIGLYRDDGLSCFENRSGFELEKIRKKICKFLKIMV